MHNPFATEPGHRDVEKRFRRQDGSAVPTIPAVLREAIGSLWEAQAITHDSELKDVVINNAEKESMTTHA